MKGMGGMMGGMMGGGGSDPNLKNLEPNKRVKAITYCRDTYRVTTADDKTRPFWERNLRFQDQLQQGWTGEGCSRDHAGRHDGRQSFDNFRSAGGDQQDDRGAMLSRASCREVCGIEVRAG